MKHLISYWMHTSILMPEDYAARRMAWEFASRLQGLHWPVKIRIARNPADVCEFECYAEAP